MNLFIGAHLIADAQDPFNLSPWLDDFQIVRKIFRFNLAVSLFIHGYDAGHPGGWWEGKPTVAVRCNQQLRTATPFQICVTKPEGVIIRDNQSRLRADCRLAVGKNDDATEAGQTGQEARTIRLIARCRNNTQKSWRDDSSAASAGSADGFG